MFKKIGLIVLVLVALDVVYLMTKWPDWDRLAHGPIPESNFMREYRGKRENDKTLPPLRWKPVTARKISPYMFRAVLLAEDASFYRHSGVDFEALQHAVTRNMENIEKERRLIGGSTISQQVAKNMFLTSSRSVLRKWHELILTYALEYKLTKEQILLLYLNVAEFGRGVYGVEAAAKHYWSIHASELSREQAVALAAALPSPKRHNPRTSTSRFERYKNRILARINRPKQS